MAAPNWNEEIGELYGVPTKTRDGWGITVYPTKQQSEQINARHHAACDRGEYGVDYVKGLPAMSIDRSGRERALVITDGTDSRFDMYGNEQWICTSRPRERGRQPGEPAARPRPAAGSAARRAEAAPTHTR